MVRKIMKYAITLIGSTLGILVVYMASHFHLISITGAAEVAAYIGSFILFGIIFFILSEPIMRTLTRIVQAVERELQAVPTTQILLSGLGLIIGLILASLITQPIGLVLEGVPVVGSILKLVLTAAVYLLLAYLGVALATTKRDELQGTMQRLRLPSNKDRRHKTDSVPKILDTSVIIDGRIAEIFDAGFIEGEIVVPVFVLVELQHIADSSDTLRRQKGRRGLDMINQIKQNERIHFSISDLDYDDVTEVDSKLIRMAKETGGSVVTTDYNLNKLASVQGIRVLNINELANAMKPVVIPGEEMTITVIKDGKEHNQGLAYLDDGTMIVVENGKRHIGNTIEVLVTSILQTSAGKMIFAKPK